MRARSTTRPTGTTGQDAASIAGRPSSGPLTSYPNLWGYARDLYQRPAFRETTDFGAFGRFGTGPRPSFVNDAPWRIEVGPVHADWDRPSGREGL